MTPELLQRATGCTPDNANRFAAPLSQAMQKFDISTPARQAMFLANVAHESAKFAKLTENLNYSVDALLKSFGRHRISETDARRYGRIDGKQPANQEAIANCIYGCDWAKKALGNTQPGDGWRFIARGPLGVTGRYNHARLRDNLRVEYGNSVPDFEQNPEALLDPLWGSLAAGMFWMRHGINKHADSGNFDATCDIVNLGKVTPTVGDSNGYADRKAIYDRARPVLGA